MNTIVLKFGGTSVADNDKLNIVANKITTLYDEGFDIVVVVSAQGKKTDSLLNEAYELSKNPSERELDTLISIGEMATMSKLSIVLNELGYKAISLTGWQAGIHTNNVNQNAIIEYINPERINKELKNGKIVIVAGFQGINEKLDITTLGRGGSDTTAVALAVALQAKSCYIYSDVEGVFTSDPKKIEQAKKLKEISYEEMLDISNEGAKVLHNRCVELGKKFNIPIIAKSTFKNDEGTIVNDKIEQQKIKSLVKDDDLLEVSFKLNEEEYLQIYELFLKNDCIPKEFMKNKQEIKALFKKNQLNKIESILKQNLHNKEYTIHRLSRIAIVGYGIASNSKYLDTITEILDKSVGINIKNIDINNGKIRLTFQDVIENTLLQELHNNLL